jgi:hypothetical protein
MSAELLRRRLLLLLFICACVPSVHGAERIGDSARLNELDQYAIAAAGLETEFRSLIEAASGEDRFYLYWSYNHLTESWVQVEYLREQLELSVAAQLLSEEELIRTTLRDQAQFVRWELGHAIDDLQQNIPEVRRLNQLWINEALRSLLSEVRTTVDRLWSDQCTQMACEAGP